MQSDALDPHVKGVVDASLFRSILYGARRNVAIFAGSSAWRTKCTALTALLSKYVRLALPTFVVCTRRSVLFARASPSVVNRVVLLNEPGIEQQLRR